MIEIKLSQGAKPGHGGMLLVANVSNVIADTRNVPPYKDVISTNIQNFQRLKSYLHLLIN